MSSQPRGPLDGRDRCGELLASVLRTVAQPVCVGGPDGLIRFANAAAATALGYADVRELIGSDTHRALHRDPHDPVATCALQHQRTTGETVADDLDRFVRRDGSTFRVAYVSAPLELVDGRGTLVAFTDVEVRAGAEEALREQLKALRRVAMIVVQGTGPRAVFEVLADEVRTLLGADESAILRFEADGTVTVKGAYSGRNVVNARITLNPDYVVAAVRDTGRPARFDTDDPNAPGMPEFVRAQGIRTGLASPIVIGGRLWGVIAIASVHRPLPAGTEGRLDDYTELVAAAISNAQAREDLQRMANEQAALRRAAVLVASEASHDEVFAAMAEDAARLLLSEEIRMLRFVDDRTADVVGAWGARQDLLPVGFRHPLDGDSPSARVFWTGEPARSGRGSSAPMPETIRSTPLTCVVAAPILVEGRLWGALSTATTRDEPLPPDTESRLARFADLLATAIANSEARAEVERLARVQAALRRVATVVAREASQAEVFTAVAEEMGHLLGTDEIRLLRFEDDHTGLLVAGWGEQREFFPIGHRLRLGGENAVSRVFRTGRPARIEDYSSATGPIAEAIRATSIRSVVAVPIVVEGRLWGAIGTAAPDRLPPDTESRLSQFSELIATAIANTEAHAELTKSRARIVLTADETRRRIERDLHDGAQQQLVSLGLQLRATQQAVPAQLADVRARIGTVADGLMTVLDELREFARGIHPAILAEGGLGPALRTVARRSAVPVELDVRTDARLPKRIEVAAYFVVSEALANVAKHAQASRVGIVVDASDSALRVVVDDDGIGGAGFSRGWGLVGLKDRVEALGGRIDLDSPPGAGTTISVELPLVGEPAGAGEAADGDG